MLKKISESKKELISRTLREEINAGKFFERFPSERALVRRFAAARETVRAALHNLEAMRLIRRKVGRGTTVVSLPPRCPEFAILIGNEYNINPFYAAIRGGVEGALSKKGCTLISVSSMDRKERVRMKNVREFVKMCVRRRVAGVFFQPLHFLRNGEKVNRTTLSVLDDAGIPVVLIDSDFVQPPHRSGYDLVGTDNLKIGYDLARHMIEAGAERIVYVSEPRPAPTSMLRAMGTGFAVSEAGFEWRAEDIVFAWNADVRAMVKRLFSGDKRPDAIISANDYLGVEILEELQRAGLKVPDDVLLAGVDGDRVSEKCDPPLTTFIQPCAEIGAAAVDFMLSRLKNPSLPPRDLVIASCFAARASTDVHSSRKKGERK